MTPKHEGAENASDTTDEVLRIASAQPEGTISGFVAKELFQATATRTNVLRVCCLFSAILRIFAQGARQHHHSESPCHSIVSSRSPHTIKVRELSYQLVLTEYAKRAHTFSERRTSERSLPSKMRSVGRATPARLATVAKISMVDASSFVSRPAAIVPGHQTMPGTRMPPSHDEYALPPRSTPVVPPSKHSSMCGPWSLVKKTTVCSATDAALMELRICPTAQSISRKLAPHIPLTLELDHAGDVNMATCMWANPTKRWNLFLAAACCVMNDDASAAMLAVRLLWSIGCCTIEVLRYTKHVSGFGSGKCRFDSSHAQWLENGKVSPA
eukprot:m.823676 g.823676  ORF g.823676 m.823676 type:complete len:327 (+) comp23403_c0_seq3:2394-3374(+)